MNNTKKILMWVSLGVSCLGTVLAFVFSIIQCATSKNAVKKSVEETLEKMYDLDAYDYDSTKEVMRHLPNHYMSSSKLWIVVLIAVIIAIAGLVCAILSKEKEAKLSKVSTISVIVATFGIAYAMLTTTFVCAYTCSMDSAYNQMIEDQVSEYFD